MRMAGELAASIFGHEADERVVPVHRLNGAQAQPWQAGLFEDCADERGERADRGLCGIKVAAPAAEVDSGEDKFVAAGGDEVADVWAGIDSAERLRELPRVCGMTQKEQRLEQPSWILRLGRVCDAGSDGRFFEEGVGEGVVGQEPVAASDCCEQRGSAHKLRRSIQGLKP